MSVIDTGFDEVLFPPDISEGATGGPTFATTVTVTASGAEQRVGRWRQGRLRWEVGHNPVSQAQIAELIAFYRARYGRLRGFRFKDWTDYTATLQRMRKLPAAGKWQLVKRYGSALASEQVRDIRKPVLGTVDLFDQGGAAVDPADFSVDHATGVVTWGSLVGFEVEAVIDNSGSMLALMDNGRSRLQNVRDGLLLAQAALFGENGANRFGLTRFGLVGENVRTLTSDPALAAAAVPALDGTGAFTNIQDGIADGRADLEGNGLAAYAKAMIVLSDGESNEGGNPVTEAQDLKADHPDWKVFGMFVGDNGASGAAVQMQQIGIDGYFHIRTAADLTAALASILASVYPASATFEFDVPARFDTDQMEVTLDDALTRSWGRIPVVEVLDR